MLKNLLTLLALLGLLATVKAEAKHVKQDKQEQMAVANFKVVCVNGVQYYILKTKDYERGFSKRGYGYGYASLAPVIDSKTLTYKTCND